jgi:hypothetical protein
LGYRLIDALEALYGKLGPFILPTSEVSQKFIEEQPQILRLTTPRLKSTPGAPFAQDDSNFCDAYF